uniref:Secreted protein n=1 Tax=Heterorhabditis bacteriophora TaxID=37862 RepID=A0A1I7WLH6_HETBA
MLNRISIMFCSLTLLLLWRTEGSKLELTSIITFYQKIATVQIHELIGVALHQEVSRVRKNGLPNHAVGAKHLQILQKCLRCVTTIQKLSSRYHLLNYHDPNFINQDIFRTSYKMRNAHISAVLQNLFSGNLSV